MFPIANGHEADPLTMGYVGVYGTLVPTHRNSWLIDELVHAKHMVPLPGVRRVRNSIITLMDGLPALYFLQEMLPQERVDSIVHVYKASQFARKILDRFEGHPGFYQRQMSAIRLNRQMCYINVWQGPRPKIPMVLPCFLTQTKQPYSRYKEDGVTKPNAEAVLRNGRVVELRV